VGESCLVPLLVKQLGTASFADMCSRAEFYKSLLRVALELARDPRSAPLFVRCHSVAGGPEKSLHAALAELKRQADQFLRVFVPDPAARSTPAVYSGSTTSGSTDPSPPTHGGVARVPLSADLMGSIARNSHGSSGRGGPTHAEQQAAEEATSLSLARLIATTATSVADLAASSQLEQARSPAAVAPPPPPPAPGRLSRSRAAAAVVRALGGGGAAAAAQPVQPAAADLETAYCEHMKRYQMDTWSQLASNHLFRSSSAAEGVRPRPRMVRVGKELASLTVDLPLNYSSSVFVRVDEENLTLWRALITGPEGTPYSSGCFIFDAYFPPQYPAIPPSVLLKTTGGGSVRFNPNLYVCGKVCLSLLGTWSGERGESWNSTVSSMLQVLVSIQSLILVEDPYFNEPGFESTMHTAHGRTAARDYSANIMEQTMRYAIEEQLRRPPPEFADVIKAHFRMQKHTVVATCEKWISSVAEYNRTAARRMEGHLTNIRSLLHSL